MRLSPEAQAVLGAFTEDNALHNWSQNRYKTAALAAALRALADQVLEDWNEETYDKILAIATELENQP